MENTIIDAINHTKFVSKKKPFIECMLVSSKKAKSVLR